jgi:hypothetical protein
VASTSRQLNDAVGDQSRAQKAREHDQVGVRLATAQFLREFEPGQPGAEAHVEDRDDDAVF